MVDGKQEIRRAFGWLALTIEPASADVSQLNLAALAKSLPKGSSFEGNGADAFVFPTQAITTANSLILCEPDYGHADSKDDCWRRFLRIKKSGAIEYCEYDGVARVLRLDRQDTREFPFFLYVQLIGRIWTFLRMSERLLKSEGLAGGVNFTVNLVGAKNSVLVDLAHAPDPDGRYWIDPFHPGAFGVGDYLTRLRCRDENLQFAFRFIVGSLTESEIKRLVTSCADQLGLAYNHQSAPRCFIHGTEDFPWKQYRARD